MADTRKLFSCSFCAKDEHSVRHLIAGPTAFICEECVAECNKVIERLDANHPPTNEDR